MTRRVGHALLLVSAFLLIVIVEFRVNPRLFVTPGRSELIDPWIYTGFFLSLPSFVHRFPDTYYGSRLSVILPGFAVHAMFSPLVANYVLHVTLLGALWLATYGFVRLGASPVTALLVALTMAWNPTILSAVSWDYVDGFGIVFLVITLMCLERAVRADGAWLRYGVGAGIALACMLTANVFLVTLLPVFAGFLLMRSGRERWRLAGAIAAASAAGMTVTLGCLGAINASLGGRYWFLQPQLRAVTTLTAARNPWQLTGYGWLVGATWLVLPAAATIGAASSCVRWVRAGSAMTFEMTLQFVLLTAVTLWLAIQVSSTPVLQISYYSSYLAPLGLLALPLQGTLPAALDRTRLVLLAAVTVTVFALGHWLMLSDVRWFWASVQPAWAVRVLSRMSWIGPSQASDCLATVVALLAGVLAVTALQAGGPAARRWVLFCAGLTISYGAKPWIWPEASETPVTRYEETVAAHRFIDEHIEGHAVRFWYRLRPDTKTPVRSIASTFLWGYVLVNEDLPVLRPEEANKLTPETRLVLLVPATSDAQVAREPLRRFGWDLEVLARREFGTGELAMAVVIGEVTRSKATVRTADEREFPSPAAGARTKPNRVSAAAVIDER